MRAAAHYIERVCVDFGTGHAGHPPVYETHVYYEDRTRIVWRDYGSYWVAVSEYVDRFGRWTFSWKVEVNHAR